MMRLKLNSTKVLVISIILILVTTGNLIFYYNYKFNEQNKVFNDKLSDLNKDINENINQLKQSLKKDISSLGDDLASEMGIIDEDLMDFKNNNEKEINTLNNLIDEIEKQSEIQLGELKEELKDIRIKSKDFTAIIDDVIQSVVSVRTDRGLGSGVVIDDRGFIATNYHVVDGASQIRVLTYDKTFYDADLIGYDDETDIAVLKVNASISELRFGNSNKVNVGERVIALGNPAGLSFTVTEGIISAVHRKGPNNLDIYLQTDVPINPGNSGGPLVNTNSRIIGINNFKIGGFEGLGFAIESNSVEEIADDIIGQYLQQTQILS